MILRIPNVLTSTDSLFSLFPPALCSTLPRRYLVCQCSFQSEFHILLIFNSLSLSGHKTQDDTSSVRNWHLFWIIEIQKRRREEKCHTEWTSRSASDNFSWAQSETFLPLVARPSLPIRLLMTSNFHSGKMMRMRISAISAIFHIRRRQKVLIFECSCSFFLRFSRSFSRLFTAYHGAAWLNHMRWHLREIAESFHSWLFTPRKLLQKKKLCFHRSLLFYYDDSPARARSGNATRKKSSKINFIESK